MINERLKNNQFTTKNDFQQALQDILAPLMPQLKQNGVHGYLDLGSSGTNYVKKTREIEAFLRPLWGLAPYSVDENSEYLELAIEGIKQATNPNSPDYWGDIRDYDQIIVEMAALATFILLNPELIKQRFSKPERENLFNWLGQLNEHKPFENNWLFFRVLVNVALKKNQQPYSQELLDRDLDKIDSFYVGDGWYFDGTPLQRDYYIAFAIHYYSLIYYRFMQDEDPKRCAAIKERAIAFAQDYQYWFDAKGEGIAYGRSLIYRFAQSAFLSALVFADIEALPWGEIKGLLSRNMHNWFQQDVFSNDGLLTVGYHYQNLVFAEGYNGPGSPYWSLKAFLLLAVPASHPFWQSESLPLQLAKNLYPCVSGRNFYQHDSAQTLLCFPAGQANEYQSHGSAKYNKFVYSTKTGFSVPKSSYLYHQGAYDNCLALAEGDHYFRTKDLDTKFEILADRVIHYWQPWPDVAIKTTLIPFDGWHLRIEEIRNQLEIDAYEGGFSVPFAEDAARQIRPGDSTQVASTVGISWLKNLHGFTEADVAKTEPNTSLFFPLTNLPYLKQHLAVGQHLLVSAVGLTDQVAPDLAAIDVQLRAGQLMIKTEQGNKVIQLTAPDFA
ncbi:DUF2264 domain-containing protein [Lapidilactobacillus wuchangensis]|uniref:DUF2264 domain-containing protein n=1 Tax=Lapidilactobacillus wuchangensis TaxID=2486001 RepID=UPI000F770C19|nr:DUF2264 domain-containing protein [Lapidilactobacillus wuchangensis]